MTTTRMLGPEVLRRGSRYWLSFSLSRFLNELHLGKLSETVVVHSNAPHDRPRFLVNHLIGNRASFLCTKAPMPRVISEWHRISGRDVQAIFFRRRHQPNCLVKLLAAVLATRNGFNRAEQPNKLHPFIWGWTDCPVPFQQPP